MSEREEPTEALDKPGPEQEPGPSTTEMATQPSRRPTPEPNELRLGPNLSLHGDGAQRCAFFGALAAAQGGFDSIERSRTVTVQPKDRGQPPYKFDYAPLENVIHATRPALAAQGIAWSSYIEDAGEGIQLHTLLTHSSGAFMHAVEFMRYPEKPQEMGSLLTYARRYQYQAITGTAPEHDDDANGASGNEVTAKTDKPRSAPKPADKPAPRKQEFLPASADELELTKVLSDDELRNLISKRLEDLRVAPNQLARAAKIREVAGADYAQLDRPAKEQLAVTLGKLAAQQAAQGPQS